MAETLADRILNSRLGRTISGAVELPLSVGTGAATFPFALAGGAGELLRGKGQYAADEAIKDIMMRGTYSPRTPGGQDTVSEFGSLMDKLKVPPYVPGVGPMAQQARMAARAAPEFAAKGASNLSAGRGMTGPSYGSPQAQIGAVRNIPGGEPKGYVSSSAAMRLENALLNALPDEPSAAMVKWAKREANSAAGDLGTPQSTLNAVEFQGKKLEPSIDRTMQKIHRATLAQHYPEDAGLLAAKPDLQEAWTVVPAALNPAKFREALQAGSSHAATLTEDQLRTLKLADAIRLSEEAKTKARPKVGTLEEQTAGAKRIMEAEAYAPAIIHDTDKIRVHQFDKKFSEDAIAKALCAHTGMNDSCIAAVQRRNKNPEDFGYSPQKQHIPVFNVITGEQTIPGPEGLKRYAAGHISRTQAPNKHMLWGMSDKETGYPIGNAGIEPVFSYQEAIAARIAKDGAAAMQTWPRGEVRGALGHAAYNNWVRSPGVLGQRGGRVEHQGGGYHHNPQAPISIADFRNMVQQFPELQGRIQEKFNVNLNAPDVKPLFKEPTVRNKIEEFRGYHNLGAAPGYAPDYAKFLNEQLAKGKLAYPADLSADVRGTQLPASGVVDTLIAGRDFNKPQMGGKFRSVQDMLEQVLRETSPDHARRKAGITPERLQEMQQFLSRRDPRGYRLPADEGRRPGERPAAGINMHLRTHALANSLREILAEEGRLDIP